MPFLNRALVAVCGGFVLVSNMSAWVGVNLTSPHCTAMSCTERKFERSAGLAMAGIRICLFVLVGMWITPLWVAGG